MADTSAGNEVEGTQVGTCGPDSAHPTPYGIHQNVIFIGPIPPQEGLLGLPDAMLLRILAACGAQGACAAAASCKQLYDVKKYLEALPIFSSACSTDRNLEAAVQDAVHRALKGNWGEGRRLGRGLPAEQHNFTSHRNIHLSSRNNGRSAHTGALCDGVHGTLLQRTEEQLGFLPRSQGRWALRSCSYPRSTS